MIEARNVNKFFGENIVLQDVSCKFHPGKTNLIIGQSGSG
ncbi:MAG: ABC transporter ATP-binding protein, partial [Bacteroidota bacterium]